MYVCVVKKKCAVECGRVSPERECVFACVCVHVRLYLSASCIIIFAPIHIKPKWDVPIIKRAVE